VKKKIISAIFIALIVVVAVVKLGGNSKGIEVQTTKVVVGDVAEYVEELGEVKLENQVDIYSSVAGKVKDVPVNVGDVVMAGDTLLTIDNESVISQINILEQSKLALIFQHNESDELSSKEVEKLKLQVTIMENKVAEAEKAAVNSKLLYEAGAISEQEYEIVQRKLEVEQSNLASTRLDLELIEKTVSGDKAKQFDAQVRQIDIQIQELRNKIKEYNIASTIGGTVFEKLVDVGSFLQPGMHLMSVGDGNEQYLECDILVGEMVNIKEGLKVEIYSKDLGIEGATGIVKKIHPQAHSKISDLGIQQKRVKIEVVLDNDIDILRPGYNLDIRIVTSSKENVLLVPENSVFFLGGKNYVFLNENNMAVLREITKGMVSQRLVEVVSGLEEGEEVILSPGDKLDEGASIVVSGS